MKFSKSAFCASNKMAQIVETLVGDRKLLLGAEEYIRPTVIGDNWLSIRLLIRVSLVHTATIVNPANALGIGLSNGVSISSLASCEFAGVSLPRTAASMDYFAGPPAYFDYTDQQATRIYGGAFNTTNGTSKNGYISANSAYRTELAVDLARTTRPGTVFAIQGYGPDTAAESQTDITWAASISTVERFSSIPGPGTFSTTWTALTWGGTAALNHVHIWWTRSVPTLEISDIVLVRYS